MEPFERTRKFADIILLKIAKSLVDDSAVLVIVDNGHDVEGDGGIELMYAGDKEMLNVFLGALMNAMLKHNSKEELEKLFYRYLTLIVTHQKITKQ